MPKPSTPPPAELPAVCAVIGPDRFVRQEAVHQLLARAGDALDEMGPTLFDGQSAPLAEVLDEVRTMSLLGGRRVAVVDDADAFITAHRAALERYCAAPSPDGCLILACAKLAKNTRLYKALAGSFEVLHCEPPARRALPGWLSARAQQVYGKRLGGAAAAALLEQVGESPGQLDSELAKLSAYVGERAEITADDVELLVGQQRQQTVFAVTDAMANGNVPAALALWEQVLATDRAAPGRALAGLAWGIRRLLEARQDLDRGASIAQIARRLYTDPARAQQRLQRVSAVQLRGQLADLLEADLAIKTGASQIGLAVEKFIITHAARPARAAAG